MKPYGPDFEELMHCNELLWLIVQLLVTFCYRVFDFLLCPSKELLYCHPEQEIMLTNCQEHLQW